MKAFPTYNSALPIPPAKTSVASNEVKFVGQVINVTAAQLTLNALLGGINAPKGAEIVDARLMSTDIDTNGSPAVVLGFGDTGDDDRLIAGATIGQAGGIDASLETTGFGYQYTADTLLQVKVKTAPGTAAAGVITVGLWYVSQ